MLTKEEVENAITMRKSLVEWHKQRIGSAVAGETEWVDTVERHIKETAVLITELRLLEVTLRALSQDDESSRSCAT